MPPRFLPLSKFPWSNLLWIVLVRGLIHWLDLVNLGLSHCHPMMPRLLLLETLRMRVWNLMQNLLLDLVVFHLLGFDLHHPGSAPLLHWLDLVRDKILGKLQSCSQTQLVLLVETPLHRRHYRQSDSNKEY